VAYINSQGGPDCHPVKYIVADDGGDPSRHQALVQKLVEQDHVVAFVEMNSALAGQASVAYITQHRIPVVGLVGNEDWAYTSPMYFPEEPLGDDIFVATLAGVAKFFVPQGKTKLATLSCVEVTLCSRMYDIGPSVAPKYGMSVAYRGQTSLVEPDYTSYCQAAKSAGAQVFWIGLDANSIERVARSCASVNYYPTFSTLSLVATPPLLSDRSLDGMFIPQGSLPWMITSNPSIVEYQSALRRYAPTLTPSAGTVLGWVSAKLFQLATANLSDPPTSQSILDGLWSIKNNDLNGLSIPLTFTKDQNPPHMLCYWETQIKGGQYISPDGGKRTCL
jgi:ABC-type branched-subunit amino acid transport system substrate-binding protein